MPKHKHFCACSYCILMHPVKFWNGNAPHKGTYLVGNPVAKGKAELLLLCTAAVHRFWCNAPPSKKKKKRELFYLHMQQEKTLARGACGVLQEPAIGEGSSPRSKLVQGRQEVGMLAHVTQSN